MGRGAHFRADYPTRDDLHWNVHLTDDRIAELLDFVQLTERADSQVEPLSGGMKRRVTIARALVTRPPLILADEPTGDLDRKSGDEILDLLQALNREHGKTIIMVTHDPHASARASRTLYLNKGQPADLTQLEV